MSRLFALRAVVSPCVGKLQAYRETGKQSHSKFDTVHREGVDRRSNKSKGNVTSVTSMRRSRQPRLTYRTESKAGYYG